MISLTNYRYAEPQEPPPEQPPAPPLDPPPARVRTAPPPPAPTDTLDAPHHRTEAQAIEAARDVLASIIDYGNTAREVAPEMMPTPDLAMAARAIIAATDAGARGMGEVVIRATATAPAGIASMVRRVIVEVTESRPFGMPPEIVAPSLAIVREHHRTRRAWELSQHLARQAANGEDIAGTLAELTELKSGTLDKSRSLIVRGVNSFPTDIPWEFILLGEGWIRPGDIATFISTAGAGKSVATIQASMAWGVGLPYLGIKPPRPLRILHFSGEDDEATIGQIREGFLQHSEALTGRKLTAADLELLDANLRTEFSREHVGPRFHAHLDALLREEPVDLVIVNPLLSYLGVEIVTGGSEFLRGGLMPILQRHKCAAILAHHTTKMAKDGWDNVDDTYSAIGGGEMANIPRTILTLRPTPADGLAVVRVSKRQTTGWKDANGNFTTSFYIRRTNDPTRPAWIPVPSDEAEEMIADAKPSGRSMAKAQLADVLAELATGDMQRQALIEAIRRKCGCGESTAKNAVRDAELSAAIQSYNEPNPRGGKPLKWFRLTNGQTNG